MYNIICLLNIRVCVFISDPFRCHNTLVMESDFAGHVFCRYVEMNKIEDYKIPKHVTDQNSLEILIEKTNKMDTEQQPTEPQNMIFILKLVMSL